MRSRNLALLALPFLVSCNDGSQARSPVIEAQPKALGSIPPSEVAVWQQIGSGLNPAARFLQAVTLDEKRGVVVLFGGVTLGPSDGLPQCSQELWIWSPTTGQWSRPTVTGTLPSARAGASLAYDPTGDKLVLFGGRNTSGANFEDTWEWDPQSGAWTDRTGTDPHPSSRSQHGMVYQKATGKILLFGGSANTGAFGDWTNMSTSLEDTWEYDPEAHGWTDRTPSTGPSPRHDFGLVWDSVRNRAILVGGLQVIYGGATPVPKQDTWEWDPTGTGTWTDRTAGGTKPSPRYGHAMAYDGKRKKIVLLGGWDIDTAQAKGDLWDWDPEFFTWTQRLSGHESGLPAARLYASLVANDARERLELFAGAVPAQSVGTLIAPGYYANGSNQIWDIDAATLTFTDKTPPQDMPSARSDHAMAYNPNTRRVYLFGGRNTAVMNDFWEWDGRTWTQNVTSPGPPGVTNAGLAYDPVRKSMILYGGATASGSSASNGTWEWNSVSRHWTIFDTADNPGPAPNSGMVTDTAHEKILLLGSQDKHVWEWDGRNLTWTDRTPLSLATAPSLSGSAIMAYDEGRQRLFLYEGYTKGSSNGFSASAFWEWDPATAGWQSHDPRDRVDTAKALVTAYDSIRRRIILLSDAPGVDSMQTWELDAKVPQWYLRTMSTPSFRMGSAMAFDSGRGVVVLFGGMVTRTSVSFAGNDTWEYKVTNLGNGEGCNTDFASLCASGNCVEGICCETAACTGSCKSCSAPGSEGICKLAAAGTVVSGSCENGQACDGAGTCKSSNGQACSGSTTCASGNCVDGICCDSACAGLCVSCNLNGRKGACSPQPAGTDPNNQCVAGSGACKSTCDGAGACGFPGTTVSCDSCHTCDGRGQCTVPTGSCASTAGSTGSTSHPGTGGVGGSTSVSGGVGGSTSVSGGVGGLTSRSGGAGGSTSVSGGVGGLTSASGGVGGSTSRSGGASSGSGAGTGGVGGTSSSAQGGNGGSSSGSGGTTGRSGGSSTISGDAGQGGNATGGNTGSPATAGSSSLERRDGGSPDGADAALDSGGTTRLGRIGCACTLGQTQVPGAGWFSLFTLVGAGLSAYRLRRRSAKDVAQTKAQLPIPRRWRGTGHTRTGSRIDLDVLVIRPPEKPPVDPVLSDYSIRFR